MLPTSVGRRTDIRGSRSPPRATSCSPRSCCCWPRSHVTATAWRRVCTRCRSVASIARACTGRWRQLEADGLIGSSPEQQAARGTVAAVYSLTEQGRAGTATLDGRHQAGARWARSSAAPLRGNGHRRRRACRGRRWMARGHGDAVVGRVVDLADRARPEHRSVSSGRDRDARRARPRPQTGRSPTRNREPVPGGAGPVGGGHRRALVGGSDHIRSPWRHRCHRSTRRRSTSVPGRRVPTAHLEIEVEQLRSGNSLYDAELLRRIDARRHPTVTLDLRACTPVGCHRSLPARGRGDVPRRQQANGRHGVGDDAVAIMRWWYEANRSSTSATSVSRRRPC